MYRIIYPSRINGTVNAPASKSMIQRVIAAGMLANGTTIIKNPTFCDDSIVALNIAQSLGAVVKKNGNFVSICGGGQVKNTELNCGESGLCIRMFTPIAASFNQKIILHAKGTLLNRPVFMLEEPLKKLGVECYTNSGLPPVSVKGPIKGGIVNIDGSISSQILTGFLFALPHSAADSIIIVNNLKSKPYIDMTLSVLKNFGIEIENENYKIFKVNGNQKYKSYESFIEGDWSSASFFLVAGAISGRIEIQSIDINSTQADKAILIAIERAGAKIMLKNNSVLVNKNKLNAFKFDATDCPDLFPPLVVLASNCKGVTEIEGASRLRYKESNRAIVLKNEFLKIGIKIELNDDLMLVYGSKISGGEFNSHNDHRIAMAGAIAAINAVNPIKIQNNECVAKSYPDFFDDFSNVGGIIEL
jgi:3-phosphoshikimate 1-carboxyvinyltransferase